MKDIQDVIRVENIRYDKAEETLYIIDQTLLPNQEREISLRTAEEMYEAIKALRVRGPRPSASARPTACMCLPGPFRRGRISRPGWRSTPTIWSVPGPRR